jgi:hypothetical protein
MELTRPSDEEARRWIDRGLLCVWAFNHGEGMACFEEATAVLAPTPPISPSECPTQSGAGALPSPFPAAASPSKVPAASTNRTILRAVARWAAAHSLCTNYNKTAMTADEMAKARLYNKEALQLLAGASGDGKVLGLLQQCRDLVSAQQLRLEAGAGDDLSETAFATRGKAYTRTMQRMIARIERSNPGYADIAALCAESMMQLHPWKMWREGTVEIARQTQSMVEGALAMAPEVGCSTGPGTIGATAITRHPGLAHFHVHLMEMAGVVSQGLVLRGLPSAQLLRSQWPACGHLVHMASHLDVHLGLYNRAVASNLRAIDADAVYEAWRGSRTYYHTYRLHCHSQLVWCAGFAGSSQVALKSAEDILATTPLATVPDEQFDYTEPLGANVWSAMVRFGMWSAILARPEPQMAPHKEPEGSASAGDSSSSMGAADGDHRRRAGRVSNGGGLQLDGEGGIAVGAGDDASVVDPAADAAWVDRTSCVSVAMARWAKAVAAAALGNVDLAERLRQAFHHAKDVVPASRHVHLVPSSLTLAIAATMLDGELSYRKAAAMRRNVSVGLDGEDPFAESFSLLRAAVALDEALPYDEPWAWTTPVAHALGALLLEQDRTTEAEAVYRRDLERWPENMYALQGLAQCLRRSATSTATSQVDDCCSAGRDSGGGSKGGAHATRNSCTDVTAELDDVESRLKIASDGADIVLAHSCFCAGLAGEDL